VIRQKLELDDLFVFVGLDTSVLMDLITFEKAKDYFRQQVYQFEENFLFTHRMCLAECLGLLVGERGMPKEETRAKIRALLEEFRITILERDEQLQNDEQYVFALGRRYGWKGSEIINDAIIIASFWRKRISLVVVRDYIFEKVCRELKINVLSFPHL